MSFELDKIIIDEIIFYMENQDGDFVIDTRDGQIYDIEGDLTDDNEELDFADDHFISLPDWSSGDGYRLMERFVAALKNPVLRQELSSALNRSRGDFRAFRDILSQYPETEKQWFNFKDREMKNEVINWYNSLREEWGLKPIGNEPEDNTSLVEEDFEIKQLIVVDDDCKICGDLCTIDKSELLGSNEQCCEGQLGICFIAKTANGELAGKICSSIKDDLVTINIFSVKEEYRCLGIGKTLLSKLLEKADKKNLNVRIDLPIESDFFSRALLLEEFKPVMQRFLRNKG